MYKAITYVANHDLLTRLRIEALLLLTVSRSAISTCEVVHSQSSSSTALIWTRIIGVQILAGEITTGSCRTRESTTEATTETSSGSSTQSTQSTTEATTE